ncbi:hypothetical protein FIN90_01415 [Listeria monocytogenes]|nr:hypothetical protein [Listeria monocytogenes]EAF6900190.1 hypothetical protein [Listeria monocytogenes]EAG0981994.1 hypothetical protein [Listeria monocytogenes]EBF5971213.1 hypothetical protein [Listeria monocytogenes]MCX71537.1 hypothetical protein [Listeria monocytogenes]
MHSGLLGHLRLYSGGGNSFKNKQKAIVLPKILGQYIRFFYFIYINFFPFKFKITSERLATWLS